MAVPLDPTLTASADSVARLVGEASVDVAEEVGTLEADIADAVASLTAAWIPVRDKLGPNEAPSPELMSQVDDVPVQASVDVGDSSVRLLAVGTPREENLLRQFEQIERRRQMRQARRQAGAMQQEADRPAPELAMIRLVIEIQADDPQVLRSSLGNLRMQDADGRTWQLVNQDQEHGGPADVDPTTQRLSLTFADWSGQAGAPVRVEWVIPSATRTLTVPFVFEDVALPKP